MKLLLDTCTFLWVTAASPELSESSKALFRDADNELFLSPISAWEILVKHALGKLPLPDAPEVFVAENRRLHGIDSLPWTKTQCFIFRASHPIIGTPSIACCSGDTQKR